MLVMLTHNCPGIDRRRSFCALVSEPNTAAGGTACSPHRRWRSVRRYHATGSSRPLPLRMDLWTKSRLRILLGVIGRTAVQHGGPRGGDPELPVARRPWDRIHRIGRNGELAQQLGRWAQHADVVISVHEPSIAMPVRRDSRLRRIAGEDRESHLLLQGLPGVRPLSRARRGCPR